MKKLYLTIIILIPIILWILPIDTFNHLGIELCPSKAIFDFECLGCGITRAVMHFHHFHFEEAIYYNILVLLVYPMLVYFWFVLVRTLVRDIPQINKYFS